MASEIRLQAEGRFVGEQILVNGIVRHTVVEIRDGIARAVQFGPDPNRHMRRAFDRAARKNRTHGATVA